MFLINLISIFLTIFLIYYFLYLTYITYCLKPGKIKEIETRSKATKVRQNLSVIVYSHNNASTIVNLVELLKKQEYDHESYEIHIILDNCTDDSAKKLEITGGTKLWRINNPDNAPLGKNKAISWLLERILKQGNTNAFVFLNADCTVKLDLLLKINNEITEYPVLTGRIAYPPSKNIFSSGLKIYREQIQNKLLKRGRGFASLSTILNTDICAIRQEILEIIPFRPVSNSNAEIDYSLELNKHNISIRFSYQITAFCQIRQSFNSYLKNINISFFARMNGFKNNVKQVFSKELYTSFSEEFRRREFILSLIYPSEFILILILAASLKISTLKGSIINNEVSLYISICYVIAALFARIMTRLSFLDVFYGVIWVGLSPIMLTLSFIKNSNKKLLLELSFKKEKKEPEQQETTVSGADCSITNGECEYQCKIESFNEDGLNQVIFKLKDKKIESSKHLRCSDALQEIIDKISENGYALKVCQNCGYFNLASSGRTNCDRGKCSLGVVSGTDESPKIMYIWDSCKKIIPVHAKEYVTKLLEDRKL